MGATAGLETVLSRRESNDGRLARSLIAMLTQQSPNTDLAPDLMLICVTLANLLGLKEGYWF